MVKAFHYVQKKCVGKVGVRFFHVSQKAREIAIVSLFPYFLWGGNSPLNFVPKKLIYFGTVGLHPLFYSVATCRYRHFNFLFLFYFSFFGKSLVGCAAPPRWETRALLKPRQKQQQLEQQQRFVRKEAGYIKS